MGLGLVPCRALVFQVLEWLRFGFGHGMVWPLLLLGVVLEEGWMFWGFSLGFLEEERGEKFLFWILKSCAIWGEGEGF